MRFGIEIGLGKKIRFIGYQDSQTGIHEVGYVDCRCLSIALCIWTIFIGVGIGVDDKEG